MMEEKKFDIDALIEDKGTTAEKREATENVR
jgi:hypothetical protein